MPPHTAAAVTFTAAPVAATAAAVPPAPLRPEHSALAPLTTATSVAPRTLPQHTTAAGTFTAAPVAASTAAPVAAAAAVSPAPLRPEHSAHAPLTTATSVAPRTLLQHTAAAVTFTAAPVAASTAAPVAAAAVPPAPLRPEYSAHAPLTTAISVCRTPYTAAEHRCRGYLRCHPSGRFHCCPCGRLRRRRALCTAPAAKPGPRAMYLLRQRLGTRAMYLGGFHRPHYAATAAELGPRAMYLGGFHRPHCAATAAELGPRAMYLLRTQNSAVAPCTSAAFIAPTVPLRQQNSDLAPCTCYGSNTRPSRHSSPGPRTATILGARIMIGGITGKYTRAPTLYRIALMARPLNFSKWLTRSLPQR